jgi:fructan beta-fructosidase
MPVLRYLFVLVIISACNNNQQALIKGSYREQYRPQIHFSPKEKWMNDPNGMVYFDGQYHLFYQYYPDSTVWGPMHWGHASSKDLVHWQHQPVALFPDSLGYIFSGSAVVDSNNTSGFGKDGKFPLVAIFTHHDPKGEKEGRSDYQVQSLAYSTDAGKTWTKYQGNPVLRNPGIKDFRDPKVSWYAPGRKWIMTLATLDRISFYSSRDLKNWVKESEFGKSDGAHGGVWECPDLFPMDDHGKTVWVLIVNINPGGPNKGSATQYFIGDFDGHQFTTSQAGTKWADYGPDEYAGVTWANTGNRRIFLGWMSNWEYATLVPTEKWRSAMTIPRELHLENIDGNYLLTSTPVTELDQLVEKTNEFEHMTVNHLDLTARTGKLYGPARLSFNSDQLEDFTLSLSNDKEQRLLIGFDKAKNEYFIDRTASGKTGFEKGFSSRHFAPRFTSNAHMDLTLVIDEASVELFADNGLTVMTEIFFPDTPYSDIAIESNGSFTINHLKLSRLKSIWQK